MTTLIAGMQDSLLVLESSKEGWKTHECLKGTHPQGIVFDPQNPNRAYCGTLGNGLWKTNDGGQTWDSVEKVAISSPDDIRISFDEESGSWSYVGTDALSIEDP
jgi:photosystem II stability/assembly factor-like uncharacterized protein